MPTSDAMVVPTGKNQSTLTDPHNSASKYHVTGGKTVRPSHMAKSARSVRHSARVDNKTVAELFS